MLKHDTTFWYKSKLITKDVITLMNIADKKISNELKIKDYLYFDVIIVDNKQMQKINNKFRHINKPTDVISFALRDANISIKVNLLGEIYLDPDYIHRITKSNFIKEFILTYIHGILHLLSYNHESKKEEKIMLNLQNKILNKIKF